LLNKPITIALPNHETLTVAEEKAMYGRLKPMEKKFYLEELRDKMAQAALHLDFEGAAKLRDQIRDLES
jgi:excinuclease UvrABC helicase subunit UvrB